MKRTLKKSMSILLAITLIFGSFAFGFSDVNFDDFALNAKAEDVVASGTGGKNITWTLYADGEFVIDGTGEMYNFGSVRDVPWYSKFSMIKKITVCEGITSISYGVFYGCDNLSTVTIPESIKKSMNLFSKNAVIFLQHIIPEQKNSGLNLMSDGIMKN